MLTYGDFSRRDTLFGVTADIGVPYGHAGKSLIRGGGESAILEGGGGLASGGGKVI